METVRVAVAGQCHVAAELCEQRDGSPRAKLELNRDRAFTVLGLLLGQLGKEAEITEEVVQAAAANMQSGEVMKLLLDGRAKIEVTAQLVKIIAGKFDEEVARLLLERGGEDVKVTEEVVQAAAENSRGEAVVKLLLDERGSEVKVTEEVVKAAGNRRRSGKAVMRPRPAVVQQIPTT